MKKKNLTFELPKKMKVERAFFGGQVIEFDPPIEITYGDTIKVELPDGSTVTLS